MKRIVWLILAAFTPIAAIGVFRFKPRSGAEAAPGIVRLHDVRVQHEYVTVAIPANGTPVITSPRTRLASASMEQTPSVTQAVDRRTDAARPSPARDRPVRRASGDQSIFDKARRAFVGDGRHRPEPFPRPRGN